jgi:arginyl-tRNA synthetase
MKMMIRKDLINLVLKAAKEAGFRLPEVVEVEHPEDENHGDYATNLALQVAKTFKMTPKQIAITLRSHILNLQPGFFEKVEVVEPGFINFFISKDYLRGQVKEILKQGKDFGKVHPIKSLRSKFNRVNIEFVSANPTGPLHIGNGRSAFAGEAISNVLQKAGYKVTREYFVNDAKNSKQIQELGKTALGKGTTYLNEYLEEKIKKLKKSQDEPEAGYLLVQEIQKDTKNLLEKKLKIKFDKWVSEEKDIYGKNKIKKILNWLEKKDLVYEKEEALWLKTSQFGAERDWVIVRETGEPTYFLSDIAYHKDKIDRGFDKIINIWGADHQAHVSKIKAAVKMLGFEGDLDILILQLVTLRGKEKISKRRGEVITLEDLINEIGPDVARWFYLQKSLDTHMEIDLALAKEQSEKNPVYYVQYAHARICSILKKAKSEKIKAKNYELLEHPSEFRLIKQLIRLPEIIEDITRDYQIQRLPQYAMDLATVFHQFYRDCRVLTDSRSLSEARLALVLATKTALKNTLSLMGISAPEKM